MFTNCYYDYATAAARQDAMIDKRAARKERAMTANEWRFNDAGSAEPRTYSFDAIFAAYVDYKQSLNWN